MATKKSAMAGKVLILKVLSTIKEIVGNIERVLRTLWEIVCGMD